MVRDGQAVGAGSDVSGGRTQEPLVGEPEPRGCVGAFQGDNGILCGSFVHPRDDWLVAKCSVH